MSHRSDLIATDIEAYLSEHERKDLLRFLTCGSVDDGKSTLIGRLLHDSNLIYQDQLAALEVDSVTSGTTGDQIDLALLMDGLKAEREQGITIDVAYRYFSTSRRKFIIADTPGHIQYTRNMVTGASNCELAIILIDAEKGVLEQTRRHAYIVSLLGIRHIVVAVNKMDLVAFSEERFEEVVEQFQDLATSIDIGASYFIPLSALQGDNVVEPSSAMPWFDGIPLMEHLETVDVRPSGDPAQLRFPVQLVQRPDRDFRGYCGTISSGSIQPGQAVLAMPSGVTTTVDRLVSFDGDLQWAGPGQSITVTLAEEIDLSRGDILVAPSDPMERAHDIDATLIWMSASSAHPGQEFLLQSTNGITSVSLRAIHQRIDVATQEPAAAGSLELNDIAECELVTSRELLFDPYRSQPVTGSFILIDRLSNVTVAAGLIGGRASAWDREPEPGLVRLPSEITETERAARWGQNPSVVLLTGMTGSGKSTVAIALERALFDHGHAPFRLDGAMLRTGISRDLGFTNEDRSENLRRAAEIARIANQQGLISIISVQAPEEAVRDRVRNLVGPDRYLEVFLDAPESVRRQRDPSGLYAAADRGEVTHLPGATSTYDRPKEPDLFLDTGTIQVEQCVRTIVELLIERGFLVPR